MRPVLLAIVSMVAMRVAAASPESERFFRDGRALLKAGKLAEACEAFVRSQDLAPGVGTLLNLADCRERQGQIATAWSLFRDASALASQTRDRREAEATTRAASLEPKIAYLTLTVAPDRRVEGLVIKRNGAVVEPAAWNRPVPLDPGDYVIEGSAPNYELWSATQPLARGARVSLAIELVAEPVAVVAPAAEPVPEERPAAASLVAAPAPSVTSRRSAAVRGPVPRLRSVAIGLALGATDEGGAPLIGGRILGSIAVPGGALRGIGSLLYTETQIARTNSEDPGDTTHIHAYGLSVDYVWMPVPRFAFAGGIGVGRDYLERIQSMQTGTRDWATLRASPIIVRLLKGHVELGLHVQLVHTPEDGFLVQGVGAADVFPL